MAAKPRRRRANDPAREAAFAALRRINGEQAFANLVIGEEINRLNGLDAAFVTELVHGTCRLQGSFDRVIEAASGRKLKTMQPAVIDILRLGCQQIFFTKVDDYAAVSATVDVAAIRIGERVAGLVNAILRKILAKSWAQWAAELNPKADRLTELSFSYGHPKWIVQALAKARELALEDEELVQLLAANNLAPVPTLVVRPGLATQAELLGQAEGGKPTNYSPWGVVRQGNPADLDLVRAGRAGVQDEGSQLVIQAATKTNLPTGPWLDLCAGPGGKSALLAGLAPEFLVASEYALHRADLVKAALRGYQSGYQVICADGRRPGLKAEQFGLVVADVPCSGLGALRRRPEARWRKQANDLKELTSLQRELLASALKFCAPGGVVAYITCSPHPAETVEVLNSFAQLDFLEAPRLIPQVPHAASRFDERFIQLWPHIHQTDAMFCALIRKPNR